MLGVLIGTSTTDRRHVEPGSVRKADLFVIFVDVYCNAVGGPLAATLAKHTNLPVFEAKDLQVGLSQRIGSVANALELTSLAFSHDPATPI